jgi:two-component system NarL family sensor kinase
MSDAHHPLDHASSPLGFAEAPNCGSPEPISESEQRFRALAFAALDNHQSERSMVARLLHDGVAQILSAAGLQLDLLRMDLADRVPEIAARTAEIQDLLDQVVKGVRDLSYQLNPDTVGRAGLRTALDRMVGRFRQSFPGSLRLIYDPSAQVPSELGTAMERIAEEAVANAIRHAQCNQIEIILKTSPVGVALEVRDDGIGFDYSLVRASANGLGLLVMDYYATKVGLRLTVTSNNGRGITVQALAGGARDGGGREGAQ